MKKRYKLSLVLGLVILFLICGYFLRLDRFGFLNIHWVDFVEYKNESYIAVTSSELFIPSEFKRGDIDE